MENQDLTQGIEQDVRNALKVVEFGEMLNKLKNNPEFKAVILDGYLAQEAIRLVLLKAEFDQDEGKRASVNTQIDAIGAFNKYLQAIHTKTLMAKSAIEDGNAQLAEIYNTGEDE